MPKFQPNPSPFMKGYSYPGTSPLEADTKESPSPKNISLVKDYKREGLRDPDEGFAWYKDMDTGKISQMSK